MTAAQSDIKLDAAALREWPLPGLDGDADKESRGRVLVIAGSREIPGAALLAATAAMRAGAGKLVIATALSAAPHIARAMPEARVIGLPETTDGDLGAQGVALVEEAARTAGAVLVGPGFTGEAASIRFVAALLPLCTNTPLVLDALAMNVQAEVGRFSQPVLLTPHAGEMAQLCGREKLAVEAEAGIAMQAALGWNAVVVLKGATTRIAHPGGLQWRHDGALPGLATSGSGDVLAGLIAGLAARGAALEQAAAWGVVLHAMAGAALARRMGPIGLLARELPAEVPALMHRLRPRRSSGA